MTATVLPSMTAVTAATDGPRSAVNTSGAWAIRDSPPSWGPYRSVRSALPLGRGQRRPGSLTDEVFYVVDVGCVSFVSGSIPWRRNSSSAIRVAVRISTVVAVSIVRTMASWMIAAAVSPGSIGAGTSVHCGTPPGGGSPARTSLTAPLGQPRASTMRVSVYGIRFFGTPPVSAARALPTDTPARSASSCRDQPRRSRASRRVRPSLAHALGSLFTKRPFAHASVNDRQQQATEYAHLSPRRDAGIRHMCRSPAR